MQQTAISYLQHGLSVLPAKRADKRPAIGSWKPYQTRLPTGTEIRAWFSNPQDGLCTITGRVSGNLEIIDFDNGGELFDRWYKLIPSDLQNSLAVEQTPSGGWHVIYRCESTVSGNMKLAQRKDGQKVHTLIETRGEGGLFLCAPTAGYELMQGDFTNLPVLTESERQTLLEAAWLLNEYFPEPVQQTYHSDNSVLRPGDDYNARGNISELLKSHGWQLVNAYGDNQRWRRPDKKNGWSATLRTADNVFYVFSSNAAPFEPNKAYSPFMVYALLEHGGDCGKAAYELSRQGYGETPSQEPVDLTRLLENRDDEEPVCLTELLHHFKGLNPPIIYGLLREGETMNIIAAPKVGKSWLVNSLAIAIASGSDWLGFEVQRGRVLVIDNELHSNTSAYRYKQVAEALKQPVEKFGDNLKIKSLRGRLQDLHKLGQYFERLGPNEYKVIVIDAFYRTLPEKTDENDNGAIANLYNLIDRHAARLNCAFILIHHTSKGNQANKSVTDVGAGAGSQARAVDAHLVLRAHEEKDKIVVDAAVRSWAPVESFVLRKEHPLFIRDQQADPSALWGAEKKREPKEQTTLEEFVESCIAAKDPCSMQLIAYQAGQCYGLTEYKARQMLEMAAEQGLVVRIKAGSKMMYVKNRDGFSGEKGQWIAALLTHKPNMDCAEIARLTGVSERYVRRLKSGTECGTEAELEEMSSAPSSALSPCNESI